MALKHSRRPSLRTIRPPRPSCLVWQFWPGGAKIRKEWVPYPPNTDMHILPDTSDLWSRVELTLRVIEGDRAWLALPFLAALAQPWRPFDAALTNPACGSVHGDCAVEYELSMEAVHAHRHCAQGRERTSSISQGFGNR